MIEQKPVNIYIESNPNPNSLKFVVDYLLVPQGESYDFPDEESAKHAPLAKALFNQFDEIERVFYMSNFVTVTKKNEADWTVLQQPIRTFIQQLLEKETLLLSDEYESPTETQSTSSNEPSEIDDKIRFVLNEYVKPAVEQDGGAITFQSFNDGVVHVLLQGSCSGCPSSTITLKAGIENLLKRMVPEVQAVEAEGV
jgi:Fe-S cluster biogenesis protein NfuA